jgi:S-(hydroxymethyl)glutathione dehydrogenase / alcohol dehydrogenase
MPLEYQAAVLHEPGTPLRIETIVAADLQPTDVLVRIRAAGLCHTDLEVIQGQLRYPMPIILGHETAGIVEAVGSEARGVRRGDHVVLSWNPHCGHCFYCDRDLPILCDTYQREGAHAVQFDGASRASLRDGRDLHHLMFLGAFAEYCIVPDQSAVPVPREIPFDVACLIGCGVMTGAGAALNIAEIGKGDSVLVVGCGAVGLAAVQGARLAGAGKIFASDFDARKLDLAMAMGATHRIDAAREDAVSVVRTETSGRGVDVVLESAGNSAAFRITVEAVRPGGQVIWLGKTDVQSDITLRWGALMGEKRIRRSSYGGARPARDFPMLAQAYLDGKLLLDELITQRIALSDINAGFDALARGEAIRSVIVF